MDDESNSTSTDSLMLMMMMQSMGDQPFSMTQVRFNKSVTRKNTRITNRQDT